MALKKGDSILNDKYQILRLTGEGNTKDTKRTHPSPKSEEDPHGQKQGH